MIIENEKWTVRCEGASTKGFADRIAGGTKIGDTRIEPMRSDKSRGVENGLFRPAPGSGADGAPEGACQRSTRTSGANCAIADGVNVINEFRMVGCESSISS